MKTNIIQRISVLSVVAAVVGAVFTPVVVSAASENTTVTATVDGAITISTGGSVAFTLVPTAGGVVSSNSDTVTVNTNVAAGYTLSLKDADTTTSLVSGGNSFTAHTGTHASPTALTNGTWGYAVAGGNFDGSYSQETNATSSATKWAGILPSSNPTGSVLKTTASAAVNDDTVVWYAARANTAQAPGAYTDTVTYTAVTN